MSQAPHAVLFLCGWNAVRSPMAAALLKAETAGPLYIASAGVRRGDLDPFAVAAMAELGIDISAHEPASLAELADTNFDLVVTLAPEAHHAAIELTRSQAFEVEYWPVLDPTATSGSREQIIEAYRQLRDDLARRIKQRFSTPPR